jgi:hypothetical protein
VTSSSSSGTARACTGALPTAAPRARDPLGSPKVTRGRVPKVLYCCTTESFWRPFWYPFLCRTCTHFYKKLQNEAPKSCQKGGCLGCLRCLLLSLELLKNNLQLKVQAPQAPQAPAQEVRFRHFWKPHFAEFLRTLCKNGQKHLTKMASKMEPLCNSLALWGPPPIHVISRLHGP